MKIDLEQVKALLEMVSETDIAELTIEVEEEKITIKKRIDLRRRHPHSAAPGLPGSVSAE